MENEFKDEFIREVVRKGARKMPNHNFEDQMMSIILASNNYKSEVSARLMLSLKFFIGAMVLGLVMIFSLLLEHVSFSVNLKYMAIGALFVTLVIGILNIDNYKRLLRKYSV